MRFEIVVAGASLGGMSALRTLLSGLIATFRTPVAIVQHQPPGTPGALAEFLQSSCTLPVSEPEDKSPIEPGHIYIAPPDYHLLIERGRFALSTESRRSHSRPSVDVLFESAASAYGAAVLAVVLTGSGADGAEGARRIHASGGTVMIQHPAEAESPAMPLAAAVPGHADLLVSLDEMADLIMRLCGGGPGRD